MAKFTPEQELEALKAKLGKYEAKENERKMSSMRSNARRTCLINYAIKSNYEPTVEEIEAEVARNLK